MASNILDKYSVPLPGVARAPMKQPKPKYRFRVILFGFGATGDGNFISLDTNTAGAPSVSHDSVAVDSYNSKAYYKGKYTWSTIDLAFRDTVGNMPLKALWNQLRKEFNYYSQESRLASGQYKFEMWIQTLDGSNSDDVSNLFQGTISTWICQGCQIVDNNFGDWDYSSSDPQVVTMTVQPDGCVLVGPSGLPLGDEVSGTGTAANAGVIATSPTTIDSNTLPDQNFYYE